MFLLCLSSLVSYLGIWYGGRVHQKQNKGSGKGERRMDGLNGLVVIKKKEEKKGGRTLQKKERIMNEWFWFWCIMH